MNIVSVYRNKYNTVIPPDKTQYPTIHFIVKREDNIHEIYQLAYSTKCVFRFYDIVNHKEFKTHIYQTEYERLMDYCDSIDINNLTVIDSLATTIKIMLRMVKINKIHL